MLYPKAAYGLDWLAKFSSQKCALVRACLLIGVIYENSHYDDPLSLSLKPVGVAGQRWRSQPRASLRVWAHGVIDTSVRLDQASIRHHHLSLCLSAACSGLPQ